jgi:uncharacterized protein (TIGR01777 family)
MKKVVIIGGSGFIGRHLCQKLLKSNNYQVSIFTRNIKTYKIISTESVVDKLDITCHYDIIINLAGEKIDKQRWSKSFKNKLYSSRIDTTEMIISYIKSTNVKPELLISGSAIGFYGGEFSHQLCFNWEQCALQAQQYGVSVALLRTGIVLDSNCGMLKKLLLPFKLGLGTIIGDGTQFMSWIHIRDYINITQLIIDKKCSGVFNMVSENPVTNHDFSILLAQRLHRPLFLRLPKFLVKLIFGEMGQELMLDSIQVFPEQIAVLGYSFLFPTLDRALADILASDS